MPDQEIAQSELEIFLSSGVLPVGDRIVDKLQWIPEKNSKGGELQYGCDYLGYHLTRNKMYGTPGSPDPARFIYGINDHHSFEDINVLEFYLQRFSAGNKTLLK